MIPTVALLDREYRVVERLKAEPECGKDFCDTCGDCLHCYGEGPCGGDEHTPWHAWCVYAEDTAEWRERHPEAEEVS